MNGRAELCAIPRDRRAETHGILSAKKGVVEYRHLPDLAERPADAKGFKAILLVDDDRELVQTMQWIFADESFLVDRAYDGVEAMLKVKANEYDAVICDLMMPRLRGDEFFREATRLRPSLARRFVFVTGHAKDPTIQPFLAQRLVRYFVKPVRLSALVECVKEIVGPGVTTP